MSLSLILNVPSLSELTAMCRTIGMAVRRVRVIRELSRKVLDVGG